MYPPVRLGPGGGGAHPEPVSPAQEAPALRRCGQLAAPILTGAVRPVILLPDLPPGGAALQYGLLRPDCPFWEGRHATAADGRLNIWSADGGPEVRIPLS